MSNRHDVRFPNESSAYREARNRLLDLEIELEDKLLAVAEERRRLPPGGPLKEDYVFDELVDGKIQKVRLSELFSSGKDSLLIYSFMYGPKAERPCPMCTSLIDGFDGAVHHVNQRATFVVVAKSPIERIHEFARTRGWRRVRLLSSQGNSYNTDYFGESPKDGQLPAVNVFARSGTEIRHFYSTEMLYADRGVESCHADRIWALWNILDLTPEGRGSDWYPSFDY